MEQSMSVSTPYLTDSEINQICEPLTNGAAQIRFFAKLGMVAKPKPSGRPLVARAEFERVMTGAKTEQAAASNGLATPNIVGLQNLFQRRKHGTRT